MSQVEQWGNLGSALMTMTGVSRDQLYKRLREQQEEYKSLTDDELCDLFAPTDLVPGDWPEVPWKSSLPPKRFELVMRSRFDAKESWMLLNPPEDDHSVRLVTPRECFCKGAKWVGGHFKQGHPDFGKAVPCACLDKEYRKEQKQRWLDESGLDSLDPMFKTFTQWDRARNPECQNAYEASIEWSQQEEGSPLNLLLMGSTGLGKTHLAKAAAFAVLSRNQHALFISGDEFAERTRQEMGIDATPFLRDLIDIPYLILDDIGREHVTDFITDRLYRLFNWREGRYLPTMVTTNYMLEDLKEVYSAPLASRLSRGRTEVLIGKDQRREQTT